MLKDEIELPLQPERLEYLIKYRNKIDVHHLLWSYIDLKKKLYFFSCWYATLHFVAVAAAQHFIPAGPVISALRMQERFVVFFSCFS